MREKPNVSDDLLQACLEEHYQISVVTLHFMPVGLDSRAAVYKVVSEYPTFYLLKIKSDALYEPSCFVPSFLVTQGIETVVMPLLTKSNRLWTHLGDWSVQLFPFIEGITGWEPEMSNESWKEVGKTLKQIHQVTLPSEGLPLLRKETFDATGYSAWIQGFETQQTDCLGRNKYETTLLSSWKVQQLTIHRVLALMEKLAELLRNQSAQFVICHADLHPGNLIRTPSGQVFVIDWDEVMLAPKERDFLFVSEGSTAQGSLQEPSPFFQGYGETEIDWVALTYYRCERVIQDLIACAQQVFFRDDLGEETMTVVIEQFDDIFREGGELSTAFAAAAHLGSNFG